VDDEIEQLRGALRGALGTRDGAPPAVDPQWRRGWGQLAALGVPALCVPEHRGGLGFHVEAAVATATELGAALHGAPFAGLTASAYSLSRIDDPLADELLRAVLAGDRICALGILDAGAGIARLVDGAPDADSLVLLDRSRDEILLVTEAGDWAIEAPLPAFDVTRTHGDVIVETAVDRWPGDGGTARDLYGLLLCADALGGVRRMLDRTVDYANQRQAFGRSIGGFQAVQHRLVDHTVRARGMSLVVAEAARLLATGSPDASRSVAVAEVAVGSGAVHLLHDLVQLTGAIGFTWEYGLHLYERRAHQDARLAAGPRAAIRRLAVTEGWAEAGSGGR
jgi:alkylation response protein AidB-like acyl-CoA dehydrogenase